MSDDLQWQIAANIERFSGFADHYDACRPRPPRVIIDILTQYAGGERPKLVVDLGSGTGLSTLIWADAADEAIGVEPNPDMRAKAEAQAQASGATNVRFEDGLSIRTGLPDGCADIVTCSQSLHWMEPEPTFAEVHRMLRPGGVFAAIDCDWPPAINSELDQVSSAFHKHVRCQEQAHGVYNSVKRWSKDGHLQRIRESGHFRFTREVLAHCIETGTAERLVGLELSMGSVEALLKLGLTEAEIGLDKLRKAANRALGDQASPWFFSYRIRLGVK